MEKARKKILIIEDLDCVMKSLCLLFNELEKEILLTRNTTIKSVEQGIIAVKEDTPNIILLDHNLGQGDKGLEILENKEISDKIRNKKILILSTSVAVTTCRELTEAYRQKGVEHFPGKDFKNIRNCLNGNCRCYSPLISFLP